MASLMAMINWLNLGNTMKHAKLKGITFANYKKKFQQHQI